LNLVGDLADAFMVIKLRAWLAWKTEDDIRAWNEKSDRNRRAYRAELRAEREWKRHAVQE
jgi:hypothetical protein